MSRDIIRMAARAIAANAEMIATNPGDWASSLQARADQIRQDLHTLESAIRDKMDQGGDR